MNEAVKEFEPALTAEDDPTRPLNVLFLDDQEADRMRLKRFATGQV